MITMIVQRGCQAFDTEKRALHQASMLLDGYETSLTALSSIKHTLQSQSDGSEPIKPADFLPAGSVEFMREAFAAFGLQEPTDLDYPTASEEDLSRVLGRSVRRCAVTEDMAGLFIKPVVTKSFAAKVYDEVPGEIVGQEAWVSEPVTFRHEWRVYVQHGRVLGHAQYDPGADCPLSHEGLALVTKVINLMELSRTRPPAAYAIDIGLIGNRHAIVELNDGWATGYYPGAIKPTQYLAWLQARWLDICQQSQSDTTSSKCHATEQLPEAMPSI